MVMDDHEILFSYNNAANPKEQVKILADLNAVDVWTMAKWLKEHGATVNLQKLQRYNPKWRGAVNMDSREPAHTETETPAEEPAEADADQEEDKPTRAAYKNALREAAALRERNDELYFKVHELEKENADLKKAAKRGRSASTDLTETERKLNRIKYILTAFYSANGYDHATALMIIDTIAREGDE